MIHIDNNKIYVFLKDNNKGILIFPKYNIEANAYIGKNGMTKEKIEGDLKTPIGEFELGVILSMNTVLKKKKGLNYIQITENMYWVDDENSIYYNKLVDLSKVERDWESAEHLIDYKVQYEYVIEIKTNPDNIPGKESAIFLHCTNNKPTAGCIAVDTEIMKKIIENIDDNTKIEICDK